MLTVVEHEIIGENLFITLQGKNVEEVMSPTARKAAYEARIPHGFADAGMAQEGGSYPVNVATNKVLESAAEMAQIKEASELNYRVRFKFTRSI